MEKVQMIIDALTGPVGFAVLMVCLSLSELLALNAKVKANSIFQLVVNALKWFKEKRDAAKQPATSQQPQA